MINKLLLIIVFLSLYLYISCGNSTKTLALYPLDFVKPKHKAQLVSEVRRAIKIKGNNANLNHIDTSNITDMSFLFASDDKMRSLEVPSEDGKLRSSDGKDYGLGMFDGDISEWNVGNVTDMSFMFSNNKQFNGDISKWDVSRVTTMDAMFHGAITFNGDVALWPIYNVERMVYMFKRAKNFRRNIERWDTWLNEKIKAEDYINAYKMFKDSVFSSIPTWCIELCVRQ